MATPNTAFRLTPEDLALLDAVMEYTGVSSRSDALRYALRYWARKEGRDVKPKKKARTRR